MIKDVLFPTDFSKDAEHALPYALAMAATNGGKVRFVHVVRPMEDFVIYGTALQGPEFDQAFETVRERAEQQLQEAVQQAKDQGIDAACHLAVGEPADEILRIAVEQNCSLIVIATHGHSGFDALVFGSTCERLVRVSPTPVLTIKNPEYEFVSGDNREINLTHILCPCDFSEFSQEAIPFAAALCGKFGAKLVLANVVEPHLETVDYLPELASSHIETVQSQNEARLKQIATGLTDVKTEVRVLAGTPHRELVRLINELGIGLTVMATHGRSGLSHLFFGSVAEKMLRAAPSPVLTFRPARQQEQLPQQEEAHTGQFFG
jgi:nucleotide-binding universal stress UspA family protein